MNGTLKSSRHQAVRRLLKERRMLAGLTQHELADSMGYYRSFVTAVETGQHRVTIVEFIDFAEALGFDLCAAIRRIAKR